MCDVFDFYLLYIKVTHKGSFPEETKENRMTRQNGWVDRHGNHENTNKTETDIYTYITKNPKFWTMRTSPKNRICLPITLFWMELSTSLTMFGSRLSSIRFLMLLMEVPPWNVHSSIPNYLCLFNIRKLVVWSTGFSLVLCDIFIMFGFNKLFIWNILN